MDKLLEKLGLTPKDFEPKVEEITIDDLATAFMFLAEIVLGEE